MRRYIVLATAIALLVSGAAASSHTDFEAKPGLVTPDSPLYDIEMAWENAAVTIGLKQASDVVQERAAEAIQMIENGKPEAAAKAAKDMNRVAKKADADDTGIDRAMNALQDAMEQMQNRINNAPNPQARDGMENALDNMQNALNNMKQAKKGKNQNTDTQDVADVGNCDEEISIAQDHGNRDDVSCTQEFQEMQCDDDTSVTYGAQNGCEISALEQMNWTQVTRNPNTGNTCDTSTCTWTDLSCGAQDCAADKLAQRRDCSDQSCAAETRCVDATQCKPENRPPAVKKLSPQPDDDAFVELTGSHRFTKNPSIPKDGVVEFANHADDGQNHNIIVDGKEFTIEHDWVLHLTFNRTGSFTVDCTTCNAQTTITVK